MTLQNDDNFEHLEQLFLDLKVLAEVGQHEKICTQSAEMTVQPNSLFLALARWARGESRKRNVARITNILCSASREINEFTDGRRTNPPILARIRLHLVNARVGVVNMQYTYQDDIKIKSKLGNQLDRMDDLVARIDHFVQATHDKKIQ